jgi:hypothetical protein
MNVQSWLGLILQNVQMWNSGSCLSITHLPKSDSQFKLSLRASLALASSNATGYQMCYTQWLWDAAVNGEAMDDLNG